MNGGFRHEDVGDAYQALHDQHLLTHFFQPVQRKYFQGHGPVARAILRTPNFGFTASPQRP